MSENLSGRELQNEVTPHSLYATRRRFMQGLGAVDTLAASTGIYRWFNPVRQMELETVAIADLASNELTDDQRRELGYFLGEPMTSEPNVVSYNNFYEFTTDKNAVAEKAKNFAGKGKLQDWGTLKSGTATKTQ